jgi:DNA-binding response OmpR family regulator
LSNVLLLTSARESSADIVPSLSLLPHVVRVAPAGAEQVAACKPAPDAVLIDARRDLVHARRVLRALRAVPAQLPVIVIVSDGGWAATSADWGADDFLLHTAGPGEVEARLRLVIGRTAQSVAPPPNEIRSGELVVNEATYSARMNGRTLDLTFKEFELLKFLAQHPGRVFTRAQLLQEVWGYDYFGGTRTVDVHVRRLRAKLGADNEELIGTVRNVGYRFVPARTGGSRDSGVAGPAGGTDDEAATGTAEPAAGRADGTAEPAGAQADGTAEPAGEQTDGTAEPAGEQTDDTGNGTVAGSARRPATARAAETVATSGWADAAALPSPRGGGTSDDQTAIAHADR